MAENNYGNAVSTATAIDFSSSLAIFPSTSLPDRFFKFLGPMSCVIGIKNCPFFIFPNFNQSNRISDSKIKYHMLFFKYF